MNKSNLKIYKKRKKIPIIKCSLKPKVSVVIPVCNERSTIVQVLQQSIQVHPETEVIVICNGTTDGTDLLAVEVGAKVFYQDDLLGHDVGRYVGAKEAKGDIVLFLDGDIVISYRDLIPFINAIQNEGVDVALNKCQGSVNRKTVHSVTLAKHALNVALSRPDLGGCSLTTIPHALNRKALEQIGVENLIVPPRAHAIAIKEGLSVKPVHYVDVIKLNPKRRSEFGKDPVKDLIIGDHLEAIYWLTQNTDQRGLMTDLMRDRKKVNEE